MPIGLLPSAVAWLAPALLVGIHVLLLALAAPLHWVLASGVLLGVGVLATAVAMGTRMRGG